MSNRNNKTNNRSSQNQNFGENNNNQNKSNKKYIVDENSEDEQPKTPKTKNYPPKPSVKSTEYLRRHQEGLPQYDVQNVSDSEEITTSTPKNSKAKAAEGSVVIQKLEYHTKMLEYLHRTVKDPTISVEWKSYVYPQLVNLLHDKKYPDDDDIKNWILEHCGEDLQEDYQISFDKWWKYIRLVVAKYIRDKRSFWSENVRKLLVAKHSSWDTLDLEEKNAYIQKTFEVDVEARLELARFTRQVMNLPDGTPSTQSDKAFVLVTMERFASGEAMGEIRKRKKPAQVEEQVDEEWNPREIRQKLFR